jgi:hypothetical protein
MDSNQNKAPLLALLLLLLQLLIIVLIVVLSINPTHFRGGRVGLFTYMLKSLKFEPNLPPSLPDLFSDPAPHHNDPHTINYPSKEHL